MKVIPPLNISYRSIKSQRFQLYIYILAGGGGLIRNSNGEWLRDFSRFFGSTYSLIAKLSALRAFTSEDVKKDLLYILKYNFIYFTNLFNNTFNIQFLFYI